MGWSFTLPSSSAAVPVGIPRPEAIGMAVDLRGITKRFGETLAVDDVSLTVEEGEFLALLGPSGCGKTTSLRVLAGFERPDRGRVLFGGEDVTDVPAYRRGIGMVFQHYALFPHMTVRDNIAFGLRRRRVPREEIPERVRWALDLVRLRGYEARYPRQLSGGQQQRVALARAVVTRPRVLLLDEPLSNLDAKLREGMRVELRQIQREVGITTIFVTHDQEEALTLSDRVAVMNGGRIVQTGAPREIYQRPRDAFVARFIGRSNALRGRIEHAEPGSAVLRTGSGLVIGGRTDGRLEPGAEATAIVRHEHVKVAGEPPPDANVFDGRVELISYHGASIMFICAVGEEQLTGAMPAEAELAGPSIGAPVRVWWATQDCSIFRVEAGHGVEEES